MQKIVYIEGSYLYEINSFLADGWKVVSLHPISTHITNTSDAVFSRDLRVGSRGLLALLPTRKSRGDQQTEL